MAPQSAAASPLHIFFFPFLARGHTIPCVETARLFAERGARCTVVTTPGNSSYIRSTIERANSSGLSLHLLNIPFPADKAGLPAGVECTDILPPGGDNIDKFYKGIDLLRHPFEDLVIEHRPDCIVSDSTVFWPADLAFSLSIPHLIFCVFSPFSKCVFEHMYINGIQLSDPSSDTFDPLVGLPHPIVITRPEIPVGQHWPNFFENTWEAQRKSCGVLFNTFDDLAPEYVVHYRKNRMTKVVCVGPVQISNQSNIGGASGDAGNWERIKNWLDSKQPESVLYVSFGSECSFSTEQLRELALGLESCKHSFIWVVREGGKAIEEEFGPRVGDRALILTEWAPQVAILNHRAMGGFVMHCGWNSTLEAVCAGLPVIAWPLHWEQFINERLVVEVMRIGVRILKGPRMRAVEAKEKEVVKGETIRVAVDRLMGGGDEEVRTMKKNAKRYGELARSAMEKGGPSHVNLSCLIEEINTLLKQKNAVDAQ